MKSSLPSDRKTWTRSFFIWACFPAALVVFLLWYPFGFTLGGMIEEWDFLWVSNNFPHFWNSFPGNPMSAQFAARPFQPTPFTLARTIDPSSFFGFHLLLIAACFTRIIAGASIGFFVFRSRMYALAAGLLFLMLPADTQQFSFRTLPISCSIALITSGAATAIRGMTARSSGARLGYMSIAVFASCFASLMYEPVLTLYAIAPLLLYAKFGFRKARHLIWRRRYLVILWALGPIANVLYLVYAIVIFKSAYQVESAHGSILKSIAHNIRFLWISAGYRVFYDSWIDSFRVLFHDVRGYSYIVLVFAAILLFLVRLARNSKLPRSIGELVRVGGVGVLLMSAGYFPFMVDAAHMNVTQRTFMSVAPGAVLTFMAALMMICRRSAKLASAVASALVILGFVSSLYQFDIYNRLYVDVIRPYMAKVVDETDETRDVHLVFDTSGLGGYVNGMYFTKVRSGPPVRLNQASGMFVLCKDQPATAASFFATCTLKDQKWTITNPEGPTVVAADRVQVIRMDANWDPTYRAKRKGWHDLGSFKSADSMFYPDVMNKAVYSCEADSEWGYMRFCRGDGWTDAHYTFAGHSSFFNAFSANPTLLVDLNPKGADYLLELQGTDPIESAVRSNLRVVINGHPVVFQVVGLKNIVAKVPAAFLTNGSNKIEFQNALREGASIGFGVRRVDLAPVGWRGFNDALAPWISVEANKWYAFDNHVREGFLRSGFSHSEGDGTWTEGDTAEVGFALPTGTDTKVVRLRMIPFLTPQHAHIDVDFLVNNKFVSTKAFDFPAELQDVLLPHPVPVESDTHVSISMRIRLPIQPDSNDPRLLGVKVTGMRLE